MINLQASSNQDQLTTMYKKHEAVKRRKFAQRMREHASFVPLVFSCPGAAGVAATAVIRHLAGMLAESRELPYSLTVAWLRARISFALQRAAVMCIRGSRSRRRHTDLGNIALAAVDLFPSYFPLINSIARQRGQFQVFESFL